ncbi:O-antigen ligase family protein [Exiguobacterium aurantiacum]|uniref:O-antigen ligase family protein n=1 Tax=Exiguobacterium aurantiacum TaxID=33987 RepID=UPI00384FA8A3
MTIQEKKIMNFGVGQSKRFFVLIFFLLFITMNLQNAYLFSIGSVSLKFYHVISLVFIPFIFKYLKISKMYLATILLFYIFIFNSLLASIVYDNLNSLIINYLFSILAFFIGIIAYIQLNDRVIEVMKTVSIAMFILVIGKMIIYKNEIVYFFNNPYGHPVIPVFYGGGVNLEATWISLSTLFFWNSKYFYVALFFSSIVSGVYSSRIGVIIIFVILVFRLLSKTTKRIEKTIILSLFFIIPTVIYFVNPFTLERMTKIGDDAGSQGRLAMWESAYPAILESPLVGHGAGNAVNNLNQVDNAGNVHNYPLQVLLDFGLIALLLYLAIIVHVAIRTVKGRFEDPLGIYILTFFVASLVQFRGAEPIFWLIFGLYECKYYMGKREFKAKEVQFK